MERQAAKEFARKKAAMKAELRQKEEEAEELERLEDERRTDPTPDGQEERKES